MIHKCNCEGYYEWLDTTINRVRHSQNFDVLLGGYGRDIIKAVYENLLRSSNMGWYDKDDGDSRDRLDHAVEND